VAENSVTECAPSKRGFRKGAGTTLRMQSNTVLALARQVAQRMLAEGFGQARELHRIEMKALQGRVERPGCSATKSLMVLVALVSALSSFSPGASSTW
jgi:dihydrodipicolinate synthase/N-acetylneuraminate lyase